MSEEKKSEQTNDTTVYYVLGGVVLVAVIAAVYFLRPKAPAAPTTPDVTSNPVTAQAPVATPTLGPITKLACDKMYYNTKVGFKQYYLSAEGGDLAPTKDVTCAFSVSVNNAFVAKETTSAPATESTDRGGVGFRCTTKPIELKPNVPTKVDVMLTNDHGGTGSCSATFLLP